MQDLTPTVFDTLPVNNCKHFLFSGFCYFVPSHSISLFGQFDNLTQMRVKCLF